MIEMKLQNKIIASKTFVYIMKWLDSKCLLMK